MGVGTLDWNVTANACSSALIACRELCEAVGKRPRTTVARAALATVGQCFLVGGDEGIEESPLSWPTSDWFSRLPGTIAS
jgi:hypothetical protein